jgi:hypothetical protein
VVARDWPAKVELCSCRRRPVQGCATGTAALPVAFWLIFEAAPAFMPLASTPKDAIFKSGKGIGALMPKVYRWVTIIDPSRDKVTIRLVKGYNVPNLSASILRPLGQIKQFKASCRMRVHIRQSSNTTPRQTTAYCPSRQKNT